MGAMMELTMLCSKLGIRLMYSPVVNDGLLVRSRSRAASAFLESSADIFVMVDSDIEFNAYQLLQMCESAYDAKLIGGAYPKRSGHEPALAIRIRKPELGNRAIYWMDGAPLAEVEYLATGFMAVHREVLTKIRDDLGLRLQHQSTMKFYEFFSLQTVDKDGEEFHLSEDWAFCQRAVDVGYTCYVDPRVRLRHWGLYDFTMEDVIRKPRPEPGIIGWHYQDGREGFGYAEVPWVVKTRDGFLMHLDREDKLISATIAATGEWEPEVAAAIREWIERLQNENAGRGQIKFLDIGAYIGYFSLLAANLGAQVLAIEPNPKCFELLDRSLKENQLEIMFRPEAISNTRGAFTLNTQAVQNKGESFLVLPNEAGGPMVQVDRLKNVLSPLWQPDIIKVDIEGEEWNAIQGSPEIFENAKVVIFEYSPKQLKRNSQMEDPERMMTWFWEHGFELRMLSDHPTYEDWIAIKTIDRSEVPA